MSEEHTYKFDVKMTCGGCSGAVSRALQKAQNEGGVTSFDVSLEKQEVFVTATRTYDDIRDRIAKTGKEIRSGEVVN